MKAPLSAPRTRVAPAGLRQFCALVLMGVPCAASTIITGGNILAPTTWTTAGSPYIIQGDVRVPSGVTLNIEGGVEVRFASSDSQAGGTDPSRVEIIVEGGLTAGTAHFLANTGTGSGTWYGVRAAGGTVFLSGTRFSHANQALRIESNAASVQISNAVFTPTSGVDIFTMGSTSPTITGSLSGSKVTGPIVIPSNLTNSNSPGSFQIDGALTMGFGSVYLPKLQSTSSYDSIVASSTVTLQGLLVPDASGLSAQPGDTFTILNKNSPGAVVGNFGYPEGGQFSRDGYDFRISYVGGNGNDVVLTVVPEPATAVLLITCGSLALSRRTRISHAVVRPSCQTKLLAAPNS